MSEHEPVIRKTDQLLARMTPRQRFKRILLWLVVGLFAVLSSTWQPSTTQAPWTSCDTFYGCPRPFAGDLDNKIWWLR